MKILLSGIYYPMAILRYFELALQNMEDIQLCTIGPYTGNWIPWKGGMHVEMKYAKQPTIPLQDMISMGKSPLTPFIPQIEKELDGKPDLFIQVDAGFHFTNSPYKTVGIATDPHCLNYDPLRKQVSKLYNMQEVYIKPGDVYLPYAYSQFVHYPVENREVFYDTGMVGLQYDVRVMAYNKIRDAGYKVYFSIGDIFDEYREVLNSFSSVISISSLDDLIARTFEVTAMNVPLISNTVTDTPKFFREYEHYYPVEGYNDTLNAVKWVVENPDKAKEMSERAYEQVKPHTYTNRIKQILEDQL